MAWLEGYPREKVEWYPTIDHDKCVKCGTCMNCGKGVYEWTEKGPRVVNPYSCVVGCSTCANLCPGKAIAFPDPDNIRKLYREEGIWANIRKKLQEEGKVW